MTDKILPLVNAGTRANCLRCGTECVVAASANESARPIKNADGAGYCGNCAITGWIQTELNVSALLPPGVTVAKASALSHIQQMFRQVLEAGHADLREQQINWVVVIRNWDLPLPKAKRR